MVLQDSITLGIVVLVIIYAVVAYGFYLIWQLEEKRPTEEINPQTPAEVTEEEVGRLPIAGGED